MFDVLVATGVRQLALQRGETHYRRVPVEQGWELPAVQRVDWYAPCEGNAFRSHVIPSGSMCLSCKQIVARP